jgi:outer membrane lipoprotein-sorting protein
MRGERAALTVADKGDTQNKEQAQQQVQLPFVMEMKRPGKSRVEIEFAGKTAVQTYDGKNGWKLRPFLNRNDVEPFTAEEEESTAEKQDLDGPLIDYAAKGTKVQLEAVEPVEGHGAYRLKLTMKNGHVQHIWIDAQSFLDVKVEGTPRRMDGRMHDVWVYQRDFRSVQGVMVPFVLETVVEGYRDTHRMVIEKVTLNPQLADALFGKPQV